MFSGSSTMRGDSKKSHPRQSGGAPWKEIPFIIPGSVNNDPCVDPVTLYDLADVNLAHYRNSADFELNLHIHGSGTLFITSSMSAEEFKSVNPNGLLMGSQVGHFWVKTEALRCCRSSPPRLSRKP